MKIIMGHPNKFYPGETMDLIFLVQESWTE